ACWLLSKSGSVSPKYFGAQVQRKRRPSTRFHAKKASTARINRILIITTYGPVVCTLPIAVVSVSFPCRFRIVSLSFPCRYPVVSASFPHRFRIVSSHTEKRKRNCEKPAAGTPLAREARVCGSPVGHPDANTAAVSRRCGDRAGRGGELSCLGAGLSARRILVGTPRRVRARTPP